MAIIGDSPMGLQNSLNLLKTYCNLGSRGEHTKKKNYGI